MNVVREVLEKAEWSSSTYVDMAEPEEDEEDDEFLYDPVDPTLGMWDCCPMCKGFKPNLPKQWGWVPENFKRDGYWEGMRDGADESWYECTAPTSPDHLARVGHREGCKWVQAMSEVEFPETEDPDQ